MSFLDDLGETAMAYALYALSWIFIVASIIVVLFLLYKIFQYVRSVGIGDDEKRKLFLIFAISLAVYAFHFPILEKGKDLDPHAMSKEEKAQDEFMNKKLK